jgi:negative regulator of sigma E activity
VLPPGVMIGTGGFFVRGYPGARAASFAAAFGRKLERIRHAHSSFFFPPFQPAPSRTRNMAIWITSAVTAIAFAAVVALAVILKSRQ